MLRKFSLRRGNGKSTPISGEDQAGSIPYEEEEKKAPDDNYGVSTPTSETRPMERTDSSFWPSWRYQSSINGPRDVDVEQLVDSPTLVKKIAEIRKLFNLPDTYKATFVEDFVCALQKDLLIQGKLYVTDSFIAFYSSLLEEAISFIELSRQPYQGADASPYLISDSSHSRGRRGTNLSGSTIYSDTDLTEGNDSDSLEESDDAVQAAFGVGAPSTRNLPLTAAVTTFPPFETKSAHIPFHVHGHNHRTIRIANSDNRKPRVEVEQRRGLTHGSSADKVDEAHSNQKASFRSRGPKRNVVRIGLRVDLDLGRKIILPNWATAALTLLSVFAVFGAGLGVLALWNALSLSERAVAAVWTVLRAGILSA
ncbi:hypothetical protein HDU93_006158 [Gonapodya sp. JEL0774]|nr:hypothetical protein HDU93_006158 [Gonapodya sp. JEL0774]